MNLYAKIFQQDDKAKETLSAVEVLCVELIYSLARPTINEFAKAAGISAPNAAYKVANLVRKGHIRRVQSKTDKREYHLEVTEKYLESFGITYQYVTELTEKIEKRFPKEDVEKLNEMLGIINEELMK